MERRVPLPEGLAKASRPVTCCGHSPGRREDENRRRRRPPFEQVGGSSVPWEGRRRRHSESPVHCGVAQGGDGAMVRQREAMANVAGAGVVDGVVGVIV